MQISQEMPEMSIETQRPEFKLNWRKVRSESGLKPPIELARAYASTGMQKASAATAQTARDGDFVADVTKPGNRIAQIARRKTIKTQQAEINLSSMPKSTPEVEWSPGSVNINWTKGSLSVDWVGDYMPEVIIDPPFSIEIYLREKPYIKIMVEDGTMPSAAGAIVDTHL